MDGRSLTDKEHGVHCIKQLAYLTDEELAIGHLERVGVGVLQEELELLDQREAGRPSGPASTVSHWLHRLPSSLSNSADAKNVRIGVCSFDEPLKHQVFGVPPCTNVLSDPQALHPAEVFDQLKQLSSLGACCDC